MNTQGHRLVYLMATALYRYRQRRWQRLVRKHLLPTGPRFSRSCAALTTALH